MLLIVGLGNPGKKYENTPHNAGFTALDAIAQNFQFPIFNFQSKLNAQISKGQIKDQKIILAKPQTFMNNSGQTVKSLTKNYLPTGDLPKGDKLQTTNLLVIHDDIDLPLGKIKVSVGRGSAGHKGVESIIEALGTKNFTRIRIGIQPVEGKPENVESFVLKKFTKDEQKTLESVIENVCVALETLLKSKTK